MRARHPSHERRAQLLMREDEPWHHQLPGRVHHFVPFLGSKVAASFGNFAPLHAQVRQLHPSRLELDQRAAR
jgi:hypothetical protein